MNVQANYRVRILWKMKIDLAPGVTSIRGQINTAEEAACRVADLAEDAAVSGTFGVGGVLADRRGTVYAKAVNSVIHVGAVQDPTAHVERQLIDWYFAKRGELALPVPTEMIIITSLDPCAMCAGAILKSGFSAVAVAEDQMSGVHEHNQPHRIPRAIWAKAETQLKLFTVRQNYRRSRNDGIKASFDGEISDRVKARCERAFSQSLAGARSTVGGAFEEPISQCWPQSSWDLPDGISVPDSRLTSVISASRDQLLELLQENRSCLIYKDGRPLLVAESAETHSPARSSTLEVIRAYAAVRRQKLEANRLVLPHPRSLSVLQRRLPQSPEEALLNLGALGSFLEAERGPSRFPLLTYLEDGDQSCAAEYTASLPPLYTQVINVTMGLFRGDNDTVKHI
jgi:tRNA(Arg) A34 adenosine deaminase TadA